ncbi:MAG: hypothetical protein M1160_02765 [Candidatus Marsarchaeota archaeon]|nr:hypothetical protein [Candidatus Marsarchaeota archaeon]MCL5111775.1 hypothetical protein [Candidatus Marsarchaeota archaeon]
MVGSAAVIGALAITAPTLFPSVQASLVPLVVAALLLDGLIIGIWYMLGYMLNNGSLKQSARAELYQLIGTAVIMVVIIFSLALFSGLFVSMLNGTDLLSHTAISNLCNTVSNNAAPGGSTPVPLLTKSNGFGAILCSVASSPSKDITYQIDYPLAASGVVLENLTYQSIVNINSLFVFDSYLGFLSKFTPTFSICTTGPTQCLIPPIPFVVATYPVYDAEISGTPLAGLNMIYGGMTTLGVLLTTAVEAFVLQLTFVSLFLYIWPFLIFIGLVLRATMFTRKIGGLFIAVAVGAVLFYPLSFSIQYLTLGRGLANVPVYSPSNVLSPLPNSISTIYGFNAPTSGFYPIGALPGDNGDLSGGTVSGSAYVPNFYVFPSIASIVAANGCWPPYGNPPIAESLDGLAELVPFVSLVSLVGALAGSLVAGAPFLVVPYQCSPSQAESTLFMLVNSYGIYGISAYLLPILNIMITLSAIIGLSGILGGDTQLLGLAKFV